MECVSQRFTWIYLYCPQLLYSTTNLPVRHNAGEQESCVTPSSYPVPPNTTFDTLASSSSVCPCAHSHGPGPEHQSTEEAGLVRIYVCMTYHPKRTSNTQHRNAVRTLHTYYAPFSGFCRLDLFDGPKVCSSEYIMKSIITSEC